jgi:ABC-type transporter Mla subunit MlaD
LKSVDTAAGGIGHAADAFADLSTGAQPAVDNVGQAFANVADLTDANSKERAELRSALKELGRGGAIHPGVVELPGAASRSTYPRQGWIQKEVV